MKLSKVAVLTVVVSVVCLSVGYRGGFAAEKQIAPARLAVVDVSKVLQTSVRHKQWQAKMQEEETQLKAEFQKTRKELEALQANLDLLKPNSADYLKLVGDVLDKKGQIEAKNKYYEEKVNVEMQQWTESLYTKLLEVVGKVAQQKGLDIVLAQEQLDLPSPSVRDFMLTIKTKKVLYNSSHLDITDEVLAALDKLD
jgi:outer membrane protein